MLERTPKSLIYYCDSCGEQLDTETLDLNTAREFAKTQLWSYEKDSYGGWNNLCPDCENV